VRTKKKSLIEGGLNFLFGFHLKILKGIHIFFKKLNLKKKVLRKKTFQQALYEHYELLNFHYLLFGKPHPLSSLYVHV